MEDDELGDWRIQAATRLAKDVPPSAAWARLIAIFLTENRHG
jgi:hypothetical protein